MLYRRAVSQHKALGKEEATMLNFFDYAPSRKLEEQKWAKARHNRYIVIMIPTEPATVTSFFEAKNKGTIEHAWIRTGMILNSTRRAIAPAVLLGYHHSVLEL